jgi:hypothetical protein
MATGIPFLTVEVGKAVNPNDALNGSDVLEMFPNPNTGTYIALLRGPWTGVVLKNATNHTIIARFPDDYVDPVPHVRGDHGIMQFNIGPGQNFIDEDRNRLVPGDAIWRLLLHGPQ